MPANPNDNTKIGFEIAFAIVIGFCLFIGNFIIALAADQISLFDEYLMASVLIIPTISLAVVVKAKLLELSGVGALLLGLISLVIFLLNLFFVGYGNIG